MGFRMSELETMRTRYSTELLENVIPFWERYGIDRELGGYFTCLARDGALYSTTNTCGCRGARSGCSPAAQRSRPRPRLARVGAARLDFIRRYGRTADGRVYFSLTRDGQPIHIQRKFYAESSSSWR